MGILNKVRLNAFMNGIVGWAVSEIDGWVTEKTTVSFYTDLWPLLCKAGGLISRNLMGELLVDMTGQWESPRVGDKYLGMPIGKAEIQPL